MKIFIGSGSNPKIKEEYLNETKNICKMLCDLDYDLVFGAYSEGLMGVCYKEFINNNKKVTGVILEAYLYDLKNMPNMNNIITKSSFERIKIIYDESDLFLFLPGGTGTFNELLAIMEEQKTNPSNKKIILYNYLGFYDGLINLFNDLNDKGFAYGNELDKLIIVNNINDLEREIQNER